MSLALRHLHVRHPAMPAIRQQMPHIAQRRPSVATLAKQLCLAVRPRLVRLIAARYSHASPRGREGARFLKLLMAIAPVCRCRDRLDHVVILIKHKHAFAAFG